MESTPYDIIAIAVLILINAFFSGSEIAIISVRKSEIKHLVEKGNRLAKIISGLLNRSDQFLATIQVGVTIAGTAASVIAGSRLVPYVRDLLVDAGVSLPAAGQLAVLIVIGCLSYLLLVMGELIPKSIAFRYPKQSAFMVSPLIAVFSKLTYVPVRFLSLSAHLVLKPFGLAEKRVESRVSEEEINLIIRDGYKKGHFEETERDLIEGVFEFADTTVREVMTPRIEVSAINLTSSHDEILTHITREGYSRYPVYDGTLDNIKGVMHSKDVIACFAHSRAIILPDTIRPVTFVPDSKMISGLLRGFQQEKRHLAIVLDEFGGTAGLITLEDILEEIVGEIQDEFDAEVEAFVSLGANACLVLAKVTIEDFNKHFKTNLDEEITADTIAGYLIMKIGRLPEKGEKIVLDNLEFEIRSISGQRIERMRVVRLNQVDE